MISHTIADRYFSSILNRHLFNKNYNNSKFVKARVNKLMTLLPIAPNVKKKPLNLKPLNLLYYKCTNLLKYTCTFFLISITSITRPR